MEKSQWWEHHGRTRVGRYELGRTLGEGTFAKVKFARNVETGDNVAIKILDKDKVLKHKTIGQIKREIVSDVITVLLLMATSLNAPMHSLPPSTESDTYCSDLRTRQQSIAEITEMIHVASLLHDDVLDDADTRRGIGSLNFVMGNKLAVLAGDFLLSRACVALASLKNTEVLAFQLIDDVLDFTGSSASLGKGSLPNINHGIAPMLYAMEEYPELRAIVDKGFDSSANVDRISSARN